MERLCQIIHFLRWLGKWLSSLSRLHNVAISDGGLSIRTHHAPRLGGEDSCRALGLYLRNIICSTKRGSWTYWGVRCCVVFLPRPRGRAPRTGECENELKCNFPPCRYFWMRTPFGWEICPPALSRLHPALQTLDRQCTNCASAPTANCTFLQQESVPPVSSVAASACGAEGTESSSHQNSLLFLSVCFTVLLGFPCDQSRASANGPQSNFFSRDSPPPPRVSYCPAQHRGCEWQVSGNSSSAGKLDHNFGSKGE